MQADLKIIFNNLLDNKQRISYLISIFFSILISFLELLGLGLLTFYVGVIFQREKFLDNGNTNIEVFTNFVSNNSSLELAVKLGLIVFIFFFLKNLLLAIINYKLKSFYNNLLVNYSKNLFEKYIYSNFKFFLRRNPSKVIRNLSIETKKAFAVLENMNLIVKEGFLVILIFLAITFNQPMISLIIFSLMILVSTIIFLAIRNNIQKLSKESVLLNSDIIQTINQSIGAIKEIKILNSQNFFLNQFNKFFSLGIRSQFLINFLSTLPRLIIEVLSVGAILLIIIFTIFYFGNTDNLFFLISFIVLSVIRLIPAFNTITASLAMLKSNRVSFDEIHNDIMEIKSLDKKPYEKKIKNVNFENFKKIEFQNLNFNYDTKKRDKKIIQDFNFNIFENDCVGIIGPSGVGKSTLVNLISGLLDPDNGSILVDDIDVKENLEGWQKMIGYVPQNIYLTDDTIQKNIAFGIDQNDINKDKIDKALKLSKLDNLVSTLPEKEKTLVGHRGLRFSGGQVQRIGIARALYREPKILIMDEATSALDIHTENKIIDEIQNLKGFKVKFIISHRENTIKNCNKVIKLGDIK